MVLHYHYELTGDTPRWLWAARAGPNDGGRPAPAKLVPNGRRRRIARPAPFGWSRAVLRVIAGGRARRARASVAAERGRI
jgi:hypothetical protein